MPIIPPKYIPFVGFVGNQIFIVPYCNIMGRYTGFHCQGNRGNKVEKVKYIDRAINGKNNPDQFAQMHLQSCAGAYSVNKNDQNKGTDQTNGSRKNENLRIHFFNENRNYKCEKGKTYKKIDAKLQILVRYSLFKILVRKKKDNQDNKEGHGFGEGNTPGEINNIGTGKSAKKELNCQRQIFFILSKFCILPFPIVHYVIKI